MNILFTGCSSSFGAAVRERLLAQGHQVYGVGLGGPEYEVNLLHADKFRLSNIVLDAQDKMGSVDCLINNAGITRINFLPEHSEHDWNQVMYVNLTVPFLLSKYVMDLDRPEGSAPVRIISTSSMGATIALRASPGYCASKAGLEMLMKVLAKEYAGKGQLITASIAPGGVDDTGMVVQAINELQRTRGMTAEEAEKYNRQSPLGRNMTHEELVEIFDFAVNKMPEYMSGTVLKCVGGMGV